MTSLTDRMRTCAAHLATASIVPNPAAIDDAAALLIAAADLLDAYNSVPMDPPGDPMEVIPPVVTPPPVVSQTSAMWIAPGGPLPGAAQMRPPRACPRCDSRATKTVRRLENRLMLACHVCGHQWQYQPTKKPPAEGTAGGKD